MSASSHRHPAYAGAALADAARDVLTGKGEKWTETRAAVFETLAGFDRPASVYDVADRMTRERERRIPANSVYRILDLFATYDIVKRVESANAYVVNAHPGCFHDCIFLVCDICGATEHVDDDATTKRIRKTATMEGFLPRRPVIEVHGTCARCARDEARGQLDRAALARGNR